MTTDDAPPAAGRLAVVALAVLAAPALTGCFGNVFGFRADPYDYITDDRYTRWTIEVDYHEGHAPRQEALDLLKTRMTALVDKQSVNVLRDDALSLGSDRTWTRGALADLRAQYQDHDTGGDRVTTHVVYVGGEYEQDGVVGVTVNYDLVVIFKDQVEAAASGFGPFGVSASDVERAVLVHEFGHVLGLVNRGIPMASDHEDDNNRGHSDNENSVMYWAVETTNIGNILGGDVPNTFDADDRRDVCDAGGRC